MIEEELLEKNKFTKEEYEKLGIEVLQGYE